jgi:hypothetical protein
MKQDRLHEMTLIRRGSWAELFSRDALSNMAPNRAESPKFPKKNAFEKIKGHGKVGRIRGFLFFREGTGDTSVTRFSSQAERAEVQKLVT